MAVSFDQPPSGGQQQREGQVGGRTVEDAGRVADRNAARRRRRDVNVIDADAEVADDTQSRQPIEQGRIHRRMTVCVDGVDAFHWLFVGGIQGQQLNAVRQEFSNDRPHRQIGEDTGRTLRLA